MEYYQSPCGCVFSWEQDDTGNHFWRIQLACKKDKSFYDDGTYSKTHSSYGNKLEDYIVTPISKTTVAILKLKGTEK